MMASCPSADLQFDYPSHRVREQTDQRYGIVNRANAALFQSPVDPGNIFGDDFGLPEQRI
jgi:hypothetical protein